MGRGRQLQSTARPKSSKDVYWQLLSDIVSSSPVGLEGGEILIVHEHNPHVIPIDPLSHSRINSFDNTRAAQELQHGIQNKGHCEAAPESSAQEPAELPGPTSSSPELHQEQPAHSTLQGQSARLHPVCPGKLLDTRSALQTTTSCTPRMQGQSRTAAALAKELHK